MAALGTASVTFTVKNLRTLSNSKKHNRVQLAFGDGALTYSAGGIPLTIGKLGCPNVVESMTIVDKGTSGYTFMYDSVNKKLVIWQNAAINTTQAEVTSVALAAQTIIVEVIGW